MGQECCKSDVNLRLNRPVGKPITYSVKQKTRPRNST